MSSFVFCVYTLFLVQWKNDGVYLLVGNKYEYFCILCFKLFLAQW